MTLNDKLYTLPWSKIVGPKNTLPETMPDFSPKYKEQYDKLSSKPNGRLWNKNHFSLKKNIKKWPKYL